MVKLRKEAREGREGGRKEGKVSNLAIEPNVDKTNVTLSRTFFAKKFHLRSGARFLEAPETFGASKSIAKSLTFGLQSCFIHIFLNLNRGSLHVRSFRPIHFSVFFGTDELKMAFRDRNGSGAFEKRTPELYQRTKRRLPSHLKFPMSHTTWLELIDRHLATLSPNATYPSLQSSVQVEPKEV